jgi:hypothetical protein
VTFSVIAANSARLVREVTSSPIRMRIFFNFCHSPSSASKGTDLKESGGDIKRSRYLGPLAEIFKTRPAGNTVVHYEQVAALAVAHKKNPF